jgi:anti-sigma regulatory factor (Ser/Thr protein kinase)
MNSSSSVHSIQDEIDSILPFGLTGYPEDFLAWVRLGLSIKGKDYSHIQLSDIKIFLEDYINKGKFTRGEFDPKEYTPSATYLKKKGEWVEDSYEVYGAFDFSPIQYVRSRLEFFLKCNSVSEMDIMDISIATIEAIENAAKYGDGKSVFIKTSLSNNKLFIEIVNNIKEIDLETELEKKYTATTTLMRGIMVMQKLFNDLDLQILDGNRQAKLTAMKELTI